jgi:hypothetical protein
MERAREVYSALCSPDEHHDNIGTIVYALLVEREAALKAVAAMRVKGQLPPTIPDGFIPWPGGECPVAEGTVVDYLMRSCGLRQEERAERLRWEHIGHEGVTDIIAYRVHKPADFRLEAGKYYITASGERVGPIERGSYGWFMITKKRLYWHEDGTCSKDRAIHDTCCAILALAANQENSHD